MTRKYKYHCKRCDITWWALKTDDKPFPKTDTEKCLECGEECESEEYTYAQ